MNSERMFQCQGDDLTYIRHLELRVISLESTLHTSRPNSQTNQQRTSEQSGSCDVCKNHNYYTKCGSQYNPPTITRHNNRSSSGESCEGALQVVLEQPGREVHRPKKDARDLSSLCLKFKSLPESDHCKALFSFNQVQRQEIIRDMIWGLTPSNDDLSYNLPPAEFAFRKFSKSMQGTVSELSNEGIQNNRPLTCFRELVFCSLCAVSAHIMKTETVYAVMRFVFGSDACTERFQALIRGSKWANQFIYRLSKTQCGLRSWDMIYTLGRKVDYFCRHSTVEPPVLISSLKKDFDQKDFPETSVPFAIPSIIQRIYDYHVPLETICDVLGYSFSDYQKLELSALEQFLVGISKKRKANESAFPEDECDGTSTTWSSSTEPTNSEPNDAGPNDTRPNKKRKNGPPETSSKRRCRDVSSGSPEGDYFETLNGSHWSIHAIPTPSAPGSCSDSVMDGLFEEFPTSTSSPTEGLLDIDANEEMVGSRVGYANPSPLTSNHSAQQSILPQSHVDLLFHRGGNIPDTALPRDPRSRTSAAVTIPDFELETRADQPSTANLCFAMNGTLDLESNSSSNMATSSASTTLRRTFSPNNIAQQQGSKSGLCNLQVNTVHTDSEESHSRMGQIYSKNLSCNSGCEPHEYKNEHVSHTRPSPPSTDWPQQYGWDIDDILQQGLPANNSPLPPSIDWSQQYGWDIDDILQQGLPANNPQLPPSTDWLQQYGWDIDDILQQGLPANNSPLPPSIDWSQQYGWDIDDILQQGLPANNPQLPPSTDWSQQYGWDIDDILQQGLPANNPQLPPSTDWSQQYGWDIDDILQQGLPANNPQLPPSTDWLQQYGWDIDDILQQGLPANNSPLPPSIDWSQQYGWDIDDILQQGLPANNLQPPSTSWWQQCTSNLLQQDLSLSSHSPLPSLGSGQEAATAISGNSPETRYHLLFRSSLVSREGNSSWDLENSHHALGFSDPIHQNASYSPNRSLSVM
ncbi:hypothetical protein N7471_008331 [Penicillium samsonianum]|uniref:uncharacterized protein n=1 Tax=Penicillium samsonianum TaxID=1882272 RepID=UPI002546BDDB|nr:uncharacterized protein N7471_008331 [Penicillium samsonianum]KAJ6133116.1 hypothetical protein N7471_008331 [Penicillium samsonianum]